MAASGGNGASTSQAVSAWEVLAPLPPDAAIFVHLRDAAGNIVAQHDGLLSLTQKTWT